MEYMPSGVKVDVSSLATEATASGLATEATAATLALESTQIASIWFDLATYATGTALAFDGAVKTGSLAAGKYLVSATTGCHIKVGPQASVAATANDLFLPANTIIGVLIGVTNDTIAAIKDADAGNLLYRRVA